MRTIARFLQVLLLVTTAAASAQPTGTIQLENAWARRAPAGHGGGQAAAHGSAGNGAVYVTIANRGAEPDALLSATTDAAATVELHETVQEGGVMKMRPRPTFEVPGGGRLEMKPGGHHIMLLGLTRDLKPGDTVRVTVTFEKAGRLTVDAPVR
jgi:copper(I)-binding protein